MPFEAARQHMVETQLVQRGIRDHRVLDAFRRVAREQFLPPALAEFAYRDTPLPIAEEQTISQPFIVAVTVEALALTGGERVLEVGSGSGYAAAILSHLAAEVVTIERHASLAEEARERLARLGYRNVRVIHGDGSLGLPELAPFDAIAVAAGAPEVPRALLDQLAPNGRLVIPVGPDESHQVLTRIVREASGFREEPLQDVRFVPLIGEQGFRAAGPRMPPGASRRAALPALIREVAEPLSDDDASQRAIDGLLERIGDARLVLLGESTHGTSEFYRLRARITRELVERKGFTFVAVEADWPDAARLDAAVCGAASSGPELVPFARFPTWMWRNREVAELTRWMRDFNAGRPREAKVRFHGLDLYSMFTSMAVVLHYLDGVDPEAARVARARYGTLTPWQRDPAAYGRAVLVGAYESSEAVVSGTLRDLLARRLEYAAVDGERFFDAAQNARVVANAEGYYRAMYYGHASSWNLRDTHMFETLESLLSHHGPASRGIIWEHNSHVGDARATEMGARGELNVGQLCRAKLGQAVFIVGFGTDHGTVAAASSWGGEMEIKEVRPSLETSYERLCHDSEVPAFFLHLREPQRRSVRDELLASRLERAIGVIYRPDTELASHYLRACLPRQFDEYVWLDETRAVEALALPRGHQADKGLDVPETFPFGL
jgi:protein-L-isoaspartate(D-aspartate) O-methyltransferase